MSTMSFEAVSSPVTMSRQRASAGFVFVAISPPRCFRCLRMKGEAANEVVLTPSATHSVCGTETSSGSLRWRAAFASTASR